MNLDPVEADLRKYEAEQVRLDRRDEKIQKRIDQLMNLCGPSYPFDQYNFREALSEINDDNLNKLSHPLAIGDVITAGEALKRYVEQYWRKQAGYQAQMEVGDD